MERVYEAPDVCIAEVNVENGFAGSGYSESGRTPDLNYSENDHISF